MFKFIFSSCNFSLYYLKGKQSSEPAFVNHILCPRHCAFYTVLLISSDHSLLWHVWYYHSYFANEILVQSYMEVKQLIWENRVSDGEWFKIWSDSEDYVLSLIQSNRRSIFNTQFSLHYFRTVSLQDNASFSSATREVV